jgi:hypothetical protein
MAGKIIILVMAILAALMAGGCSESSSPTETPVESDGVEQADLLFEEINSSGEGITTRFHPGSGRYWSRNGYTLWTVWGDDEPFTERTVNMTKTKGYGGAGYGLVFCQGIRGQGESAAPTMLTVMINTNGQYALGKVIGGRYEDVQWWTNTSLLREGPGAPNTVTVRYTGEEFILLLNGQIARTFKDETEPRHSAGRNGYIAVIAPADKFPEGEVDVYFTEKK